MDRLETARTPRNKKTEAEGKLEVRGTPGGAEADAVPGAALKKTHLGSELKVEKTKTPAESGEARRKAREPGTDVPSKLAGSPAAAGELSGTMAARALVRAEDSESAAKTAGQPDKRSGDKRNAKVSVVDLRMRPDSQEQNESRNAKSVEASKGSQETSLVGSRPDGSAAASEKTAADSPSLGSSFSDMLSRHLSNAGAQDIVKAAHIVLRDGDTGLIRLRLEPESLGNVKIELKMTEKNITGRIVVTTDEARDAFEKSLAGLRDAFTAGGFETSSLEVSVGGGETGGRGEADDDRDTPFFSGRLRELGDSVPLAAFAGDRGERGVNILA